MEWIKRADEDVEKKIKRFIELSKKESDGTLADDENEEMSELDAVIEKEVAYEILNNVKVEVEAEVERVIESLYKAIPRVSNEEIVKEIASSMLFAIKDGKYPDLKTAVANIDSDYDSDIDEYIKNFFNA